MRKLIVLAVVGLVAASACSTNDDKSSSPTTTTVKLEGAAFKDTGPYEVGVTTLQLDGREVEVWYPAAAGSNEGTDPDTYHIRDWLPENIDALLTSDANPPFETNAYRDATPNSDGRFPLVLFSHGYAGYRDQSTALTTHVASWGFVVAAPDFDYGLTGTLGAAPQPPMSPTEILDASVAKVKEQNADESSVLNGMVDDGPIGAFGHSAGGASSTQYAIDSNDVATWVSLAAGVSVDDNDPAITPADKPSLWIAGREDGVVPLTSVEGGYDAAQEPATLVIITGSGHLTAFSDICEIGANGGGVVQIALDSGLDLPENLQRLGTDGCSPPALPSDQLWPVTGHFVVAQLRAYLGIDKEPVGLDTSVADDFGDVKVEIRTKPAGN